MTCYIWLERVLYADYNYIRTELNNARVEVNETAVYCRSLLGLQSPTLNFLDLIQTNRKCGLHG